MSKWCNPPDPAGFKRWFNQSRLSDDLVRAARCGWRAGESGYPFDYDMLDESAAIDAQGKPRSGAKAAFKAAFHARGGTALGRTATPPKQSPMERQAEIEASTRVPAEQRRSFARGYLDCEEKGGPAPLASRVPAGFHEAAYIAGWGLRGRERTRERYATMKATRGPTPSLAERQRGMVAGMEVLRAKSERKRAAEEKKAAAYAKKQADALAKHRAAMAKEEELRQGRAMYSAAQQQIWAIAEVDEQAGDKHTLDPNNAARRLRSIVNDDVETLGGHVNAVKLYLKERRRVRASMREEKREAKKAAAPKLHGGRVVR